MEEYEIVEDEPWYDQRDLEQDLQLAAELGKTLLERNTELEETLQQLYAANQEQAQELEYQSRQGDLLRQVNDQHAKVYEQLDSTSRDLELANEQLLIDNKTAQQRVERLTGNVQELQEQVEELQRRLEEVTARERGARATPHGGLRDLPATPAETHALRRSASCGELAAARPSHHLLPSSPPPSPPSRPRDLASELARERRRRRAAEATLESASRERGAALDELSRELPAARDRAVALEAELWELRARTARYRRGSGSGRRRSLARDGDVDMFVATAKHVPESDDAGCGGEAGTASGAGDGAGEGAAGCEGAPPIGVRKSSSETALDAIGGGDAGRAPRGSRAGLGGGGGGMSILSEVDERYHALLERYHELLARQRRPSFVAGAAARAGRSANAAVQTAAEGDGDGGGADEGGGCDDGGGGGCSGGGGRMVKLQRRLSQHQPEYKALFEEIFLRIQRSRVSDDDYDDTEF